MLIGMKNVSDGELMKAIATGSAKAFRELFSRYSSLVLGYGRRMVKDQGLAEDVSQEVWMRVVRAAPTYQDKNLFRAWLLNIVRNTSLNLIRSRSHFDFKSEFNENEVGFSKDEVESLFSRNRELKKVKQLIEELPDQQRLALVIWLSEDVSYEDLAQQLETSVSAVKSLLFRARSTLEQQLKGDA